MDLTSGENVLDVGCGVGDDIRKLAPLIHPNGCAIGIDASESMIAEARRRCADVVPAIHFAVGEAETLPGDVQGHETGWSRGGCGSRLGNGDA
jgi:ubiquinone/menaquinone biosynthesis C-methylase UbiE